MRANDAVLRELFQRKAAAIRKHPAFAQGSGFASTRVNGGLVCETRDCDFTIRADLPAEDGGTATAPHPGQLMRASIAACLAIGYRVWAARLGVPIDTVEVQMTCDYDARGSMGIDDVPAGWQRMTIDTTIASNAPDAHVQRVAAHAERLCPMLANLSRDIQRIHHLIVVRPPAP